MPRLYLHSSGDEVVGVEGVASHAEEIMRKGVSVRREVWSRAAHCTLPVEDSERYWRVVGEFVAGASGGYGGSGGQKTLLRRERRDCDSLWASLLTFGLH